MSGLPYETWAPQCLQAEHTRLAQKIEELKGQASTESRPEARQILERICAYKEERRAFLERLITNPEMKLAWKSLGKLKPSGRERAFVEACDAALFYHQKTTKTKALNRARQIARAAHALAKELQPTSAGALSQDALYPLLPKSDLPVIGVITDSEPERAMEAPSLTSDYLTVESDHGPLRGVTFIGVPTGIRTPVTAVKAR